MKRLTVPIVTTIVLSVALILLFQRVELLPSLASQQGRSIDLLLKILFSLAAVIFSLVISFLLYSIVAFRRRPGDTEDARPVHGNLILEAAWTAIPLIIVLSLAGYGTSILLNVTRAPEQELVVDVTGFQFAWSFEYPEYGIVSNELVLPVNHPVLFRIRSLDVIHSFWIPEFRIKTDAIPGMLNEQRVTPTEVGEFTAHCSELCGTGHAYMTARVRVVPEEEFYAWVEAQQAAVQVPAGGPEQGERVYERYCTSCHSIDGSVVVGPSLKGLFGSRRTFEDGTTAVADEEYIRNSILNPRVQIVQGFPAVMPEGYGDLLTEEEINALIEFIKSLE